MYTPLVDVNLTSASKYPCDSKSVFRKILSSYTGPETISCWAVFYSNNTRTYNVTIGKPGYGVKDIIITLTNYTAFETFNNGK